MQEWSGGITSYVSNLCLPVLTIDSSITNTQSNTPKIRSPNHDWCDDKKYRPHCYVYKMEENIMLKSVGGR